MSPRDSSLSIQPAETLAISEVFATSTAGDVVPICRIEGRPVGAGVPGATTRLIRERYWRWHDHRPTAPR